MARNFVALCFVLGVVSFAAAADTKCRGLALEGGGDRGSYQAGGLKGLVDNLPPEEVAWDVVSGISAGSLNGAAFALYPPGQEKNVTAFLYDLWDTINASDAYVNWKPDGATQGFLLEKGLYDTSPERTLLEDKVGDKPTYTARSVYMGTTDMDHGTLSVFHNLEVSKTDFINAAMSSSAFPFAFPFQVWNKQQYMDGGCLINLNVFPLIDECRNKGYADKDIIIDAVLCHSSFLAPFDPVNQNTLNMVMRMYDIESYEKTMYYLSQARESYPDIDFRYFVFPTVKLPDSAIPLHFKHTELLEMYSIGESDALKTINKGPTASLNEQIDAYNKAHEKTANNGIPTTSDF